MAAVGALLVSSGIALMAAPTTASAVQHKNTDHKIVVCKYVGTPGKSRLQTGNNPIEVSVTTLKHVVSDAWFASPTFPVAWGDAQGKAGGSMAIGFAGHGLGIADCPQVQVKEAVAVANAVPATCDANVASYSTAGSVGVASWSESASPAFGATITLTAHAASGYTFGGSATKTVPVTFGAAATGCTAVSPPIAGTQVSPPKGQVLGETQTRTPTVVAAGLVGTTTGTGSQTGLALTVAGLVLMAGAAGLVLEGAGCKETA